MKSLLLNFKQNIKCSHTLISDGVDFNVLYSCELLILITTGQKKVGAFEIRRRYGGCKSRQGEV